MIVRESDHHFTLITQHDHGLLSGEIASHWGNDQFHAPDFQLVLTAALHDMSWIEADQEPSWNDGQAKPYDFIDFPLSKRLDIYKDGLDQIEKINPYSALLISLHYCSFFSGEDPSTLAFLENEQKRQQRLMKKAGKLHPDWNKGLSLLKLWDNLSLYVCLNEPGISKEQEHPWYKNGIPMKGAEETDFHLKWVDTETISISPFPFQRIWTTFVPYTRVDDNGANKLHSETKVTFVPGE